MGVVRDKEKRRATNARAVKRYRERNPEKRKIWQSEYHKRNWWPKKLTRDLGISMAEAKRICDESVPGGSYERPPGV